MKKRRIIKRILAAAIAAASLMSVGGCSLPSGGALSVFAFEPSKVELDAYDTTADFFTLNSKISQLGFSVGKQVTSDSYIFSPLSLYVALAALSEGASGTTYNQLVSALYPDGVSRSDFCNDCRYLLECMGGATYFELNTNTLATVNDNYTVKDSFVQSIADNFLGHTAAADFSDADLKAQLNSWVSEQTNGLIPELITDDIDPELAMILINTVYFKGSWSNAFDAAANYESSFKGTSGDTTKTFMSKTATMTYAENDIFQAVRLPYNGGAYMNVYLPKDGYTTTDVYAFLENNDLTDLFSEREGHLALPMFSTETSLPLDDILKSIGLTDMYDGGLTDIVEEDEELVVSSVLQKAKIIVDENGTEAAAATEIMVEGSAFPVTEEPPFEMIADHPFFYTVTYNDTVLFLGVLGG